MTINLNWFKELREKTAREEITSSAGNEWREGSKRSFLGDPEIDESTKIFSKKHTTKSIEGNRRQISGNKSGAEEKRQRVLTSIERERSEDINRDTELYNMKLHRDHILC